MVLRVLELFCGIGGWRYALGGLGQVVAAFDINPWALATYELNHGDPPHARELATIPAETLASFNADTWVMSPPCQPFCRMGNHQDLEDRRSRAFLHLMDIFDEMPPQHLALENVVGFRGSDAHALLLSKIHRHGLHYREYTLCPSTFGIPNQRPRYFLAASRTAISAQTPPIEPMRTLESFLDPDRDPATPIEEAVLARHRHGMDFVSSQDYRSTCFIGGYGHRYVGSGSFLNDKDGVRRFSPGEIARLLGLPETFRFPNQVPSDQRYKLLGNSLNILVANWALHRMIS